MYYKLHCGVNVLTVMGVLGNGSIYHSVPESDNFVGRQIPSKLRNDCSWILLVEESMTFVKVANEAFHWEYKPTY